MELLIHMNNKIIQLIKYFIMIIKLCQLSQNPLKIEGFCPLIKNEQMGKNNKKKRKENPPPYNQHEWNAKLFQY